MNTTKIVVADDMRVIAVAMNKGGVGKTKFSTSLSVAATKAGFNVLVLDMDTQQNATQWGRRRKALLGKTALPLVRFTTENDLAAELARARAAGCDLVVIDTPPARGTETPAAVEAAHLVLVPFTADIESYEQLPRTARLARTTGKPAYGILNQATPNSRSEEEAARGVLESETINLPMAPCILHRFKVHREASLQGLTAQDLEPDGKAAADITGLWDWVCAQLQLRTSAPVRRRKAS